MWVQGLEVFSIRGAAVNDDATAATLARMPRLQQLDVSMFPYELMHGVGCISDITVRAAADHCPRLRQFNISGRHTPSMAGLTYLCERARGLTHVAVVSCPSLASLALDGGSCLRGSLTVLTEVTPELQAQTGILGLGNDPSRQVLEAERRAAAATSSPDAKPSLGNSNIPGLPARLCDSVRDQAAAALRRAAVEALATGRAKRAEYSNGAFNVFVDVPPVVSVALGLELGELASCKVSEDDYRAFQEEQADGGRR